MPMLVYDSSGWVPYMPYPLILSPYQAAPLKCPLTKYRWHLALLGIIIELNFLLNMNLQMMSWMLGLFPDLIFPFNTSHVVTGIHIKREDPDI